MIKDLIIISAAFLCATAAIAFGYGPGDDTITGKFLKEFEESKQYRLPRNTAPRVYIMEFDPDFAGEKFTFKGNSSIIFQVLQATASVTLHRSNKITIDKDFTKLIDEIGISQKPVKQEWTGQNEFYKIKFKNKLEPGYYTLKLKWTGDDAGNDWFSPQSGFFRAENELDNDQSQYFVTTQFQPIGARDAFPCWDEPGFKAEFEISIRHHKNYTALSNMPVRNHQPLPDGKIITHFERSVKMSSYLLCMAVVNYESVTNDKGNISFYGLETDLDSLKTPLEVSEKAIEIMEAYTQIPYALPKLDQITVPRLEATGMENWGLITYDTSAVKFQNTTLIPNDEKYRNMAMLVAHEVAHQWFGNLVSPLWWNDLWLNEAFATYFQHKVMDQMQPEKHEMDLLAVTFINDAFDTESSEIARPIKWMPRDKIAFDDIFSAVTYHKGAAFLHMLEHVLTEEVFQKGIQKYFKEHKFDAVVTDDLVEALQEAYDEQNEVEAFDIKEFVNLWIEQTGTPVLTVTRNYETGEVNVTQKNSGEVNPDNKWKIPISYATKSNPDFSSTTPTIWMSEDQETITLPSINKDDWIILNVQQRGLYQVDYDNENWYRLAKCLILNHEQFHPINRAQLITDSWRQLETDPSNFDVLFNITAYLYQEKNELPWISAANIITELAKIFRNTEAEDVFETYILFLTEVITVQPNTNYRLRNNLVPLICEFGHFGCRSAARQFFDAFAENPSQHLFPVSDSEWIVCYGLRNANETVQEMIMSNPGSKHQFIKCIHDDEKRDEYMKGMINPTSNSSIDDVTQVIQGFTESGRKDVDYILQYFCDHFQDIEKFYENDDDANLQATFTRIISSIKTQDQLDKIKAFTVVHKDKLNEMISDPSVSIDSLLEEAKLAVERAGKFGDELRKRVNWNLARNTWIGMSEQNECT